MSSPETPSESAGAPVAERVAAALEAARAVRAVTPEAPLSEGAHEMLRLAVGDAAVRVRQTFAEAVKDSAGLPRYAAIALARDFESVAIPILRHSPALMASDLIALVKLGTMPKQVAIAGRHDVPDLVAETILDAGNVEALAVLLENHDATLSDTLVRRAHEEYGHVDFIERALALRGGLPQDLATRLAWGSLPAAERISEEARETRLAEAVARPEIALREILKALLIGDHLFATEVLARLARMPELLTATLLLDRGAIGTRALLRAASLEVRYTEILAAVLACLREAGYGIDSDERRHYAGRCLTRIMTRDRRLADDQSSELETLLAGLSPVTVAVSSEANRFAG